MPYKYNPPPDNLPDYSRSRIVEEFERWRDMGADVGAFDFPIAAKIGGAEAVVRFTLRGIPVEFRCARFDTYGINLTAVTLAIQSMRLNEARGIGDTLRDAYLMLNAPATVRDPYEVLGVRSDMDLEDIEAVYKSRARRLHPDTNESDGEAMKDLNVAMDKIRTEINK